MKRSRLRRKSPKNSRPGEDLELRKAYMEAHPDCELCPKSAREPAVDPHHIAGQLGPGGRTDTATNLVALCRRCHDWCHSEPKRGPVQCLHAKMRAGELDWSELSAISGKCLPDMLENWIGLVAPWQWMLDELLEAD